MIRGLDRRPVGLGRRELREHRRSFVSRGRRQPRTRRPTSVHLTIVPRLHPSARHHRRGPPPPLGLTHRRRGRSPPRGATLRRRGDLHRPSATHRHPGNQPRPSSPRRGRVLPPHPSATSGGSGVLLPGSGTGSAASRLLTRMLRVRHRTSPPWVQQSPPSTLPRTPRPGPSEPRPLACSPRLGSSATRTWPRHPRSPPSAWKALLSGLSSLPSAWKAPLSGPRALSGPWRVRRGIPRLLFSASALPRDPRLLSGNLWVPVSGPKPLSDTPTSLRALPRPPPGTPSAGTSTRRHREHLSGRLPLPTAEVPRALSTLPAAGPPSGPRSSRRVRPSRGIRTRPPLVRHSGPRFLRRLRAAIWTRCRLGRRSGLRNFPLVTWGTGTRTRRRLGRRSDRRRWSLVGTCSGTSRLRCSGPRRRRFGTRWRFRKPRSRSGGRCRDPRCGGRDPATGVTGPMAGRGGAAPERRLGTRRPLPARRGGGSGWWRWC